MLSRKGIRKRCGSAYEGRSTNLSGASTKKPNPKLPHRSVGGGSGRKNARASNFVLAMGNLYPRKVNMKYEISDVDRREMASFIEDLFAKMDVRSEDLEHINYVLGQYGYELAWSALTDSWEVYR